MTRVQDKVSVRGGRMDQAGNLTLDMAVQAAEIVPEADWKQNDSAKWVLPVTCAYSMHPASFAHLIHIHLQV